MRRFDSSGVLHLIGLLVSIVSISSARAEKPQTAQEWLNQAESWEECPRAASFLDSPNPELKNNARKAILRIWQKYPKAPAWLEENTRSELRAGLSDSVESLNSQGRHTALEFLDAIDPRGPESVPVLVITLADRDPDVSKLARTIAAKVFTPDRDNQEMVDALNQTAARYKSNTAIAAAAASCLMQMGPRGKSAAIDLAVGQLAHSYVKAVSSLHEKPQAREIESAIVAEAKRWEPYGAELESIRSAAMTNPKNGQAKAVDFIARNSADHTFHQKIAEFIIERHLPFNRDEMFHDLIAASRPAQATEIYALLKIEPKHATKEIANLFESAEPSARHAALVVVKSLGLEVFPLRDKLTSLLNDRSDDVLYAAAELLGRKDLLARAVIPGLLADLRSDSPDRRSVAARQLDESGLEPQVITKALIRAVDRRDMPSRQGLINALQAGYAARADAMDMLKQAAEDHAPSFDRSFARAALRELDLTKAANEVKP